MPRNDTLSSDDDDSRDGHEIVLDEGTRDMNRTELRILVTKLKERCNAGESKLKKVMLELHLLKSKGMNTKQKIRLDFHWDGEDANLADKITCWVKLSWVCRMSLSPIFGPKCRVGRHVGEKSVNVGPTFGNIAPFWPPQCRVVFISC